MPTTRRETPTFSEPTDPHAAMTVESLANRLREGPLRTLLTLQVRAGVLAADGDADHRARLERLVELAQLARMGTVQFQAFTAELQSLIDRMVAQSRELR